MPVVDEKTWDAVNATEVPAGFPWIWLAIIGAVAGIMLLIGKEKK